jgi:hypothetical protein
LFVIDAGKCFGLSLPGETVLQNGDSTADTERLLLWSRHFAKRESESESFTFFLNCPVLLGNISCVLWFVGGCAV